MNDQLIVVTMDQLTSLLNGFKTEILNEVKHLIPCKEKKEQWLKSREVKEMLKCSDTTLQSYRDKGKLPFSKIGGTYYYSPDNVDFLIKQYGKILA